MHYYISWHLLRQRTTKKEEVTYSLMHSELFNYFCTGHQQAFSSHQCFFANQISY